MKMRNAIGAILGLGLIGSLALAGCGSGGSGGGTPAGTSGGSAAATGGSSGAAAAGTQGNYVMVKLTPNEQIFGVSGQQCGTNPGPCFDQGGYSLDPNDPALPNKGKAGTITSGGIPFAFLGNGGGKAVPEALNFGPEQKYKATVNVPAGQYKNMYLLGSAGNGGTAANITYTYSDGSTGTATQVIDDWCKQPSDGTAAYTLTDRLKPADASQDGGCANSVYLDLFTVQVSSPSKTLKSVTFDGSADTNNNFEPEILAITLQK